MTGHEYEYLAANYLRNCGYTGVKVTKGSGDFGVDIIAHSRGKRYAVQCKYYVKPVGPSAIQEAVAGKAMYDCNAAMVITNNTFTKAAKELAKANNVLLISEVRSAKRHWLPLPLRILSILIYLLFVSAMIYSTIDIIQNESFWESVRVIINMLIVVTFPIVLILAIKWAFRLTVFLIKKMLGKIRSFSPSQMFSHENIPVEEARPPIETFCPAINYIECNDEYLNDAIYYVIEKQRASIAMLQREYRIGFNRAAQLIDVMYELGIVGADDGSHPRQVLISKDFLLITKNF